MNKITYKIISKIKEVIPESTKRKLRPIKRKIEHILGLEKPILLNARAHDENWGKHVREGLVEEIKAELTKDLTSEIVQELKEEMSSIIRQAKREALFEKLIAPIAITLAILAWLLFPIKAEARSYDVNKAKFDINILSNGDALIKETWILDYVGEYSRLK